MIVRDIVAYDLRFHGLAAHRWRFDRRSLSFRQTIKPMRFAEALAHAWMVFVGVVALIVIVSAVFYQVQNGNFPFREVAIAALIESAALALTFSLWAVVGDRFAPSTIFGVTVGCFLWVPAAWVFFVCGLYVGPRIVGA